MGLLPVVVSYTTGPKHPLKESYSNALGGHRLDE